MAPTLARNQETCIIRAQGGETRLLFYAIIIINDWSHMSQAQARSEFSAALNQVSAERGIDPEVVIESIKAAILAAFRKDYPEQFSDIDELAEDNPVSFNVSIDPMTGQTAIQRTEDGKTVDVTPPGFGRIAAQTAKQVILQRVREAEKDAIIEEYEAKVDTMISGMVLRFDGKNVIFDIGRGQGFMPPEEQIRGEFYKINQRMSVYIAAIRETMRGRTIIVSRSRPELVRELFAREVPEVSSNAVEIVAIAREAGVRTKMSVNSNQPGVDPVGSCVGQKGVRVQEVINELNNEKIDIIQFEEDIVRYIASSLAPADNLKIEIDQNKKVAIVTVPDDQLSLAIGKGGQNVRLAAKLTGYKIDIKGSDGQTFSATVDDSRDELDLLDISSRAKKALSEAGIITIQAVKQALDDDSLISLEGIGPKAVDEIGRALEKVNDSQVETEPISE